MAGSSIIRLFRPGVYGATATSFRFVGPLHRFDHQRDDDALSRSRLDAERGIYYAASSLSGCVVEVFGDIGIIECGDWHVAQVQVTRDLQLLNLRGRGAMRAGTVAAIAKETSRPLTQAWSRHFYEKVDVYTRIDGVAYLNAHDDSPAFALYERCALDLQCPAGWVRRLDHPTLRHRLLAIADRHNLLLT